VFNGRTGARIEAKSKHIPVYTSQHARRTKEQQVPKTSDIVEDCKLEFAAAMVAYNNFPIGLCCVLFALFPATTIVHSGIRAGAAQRTAHAGMDTVSSFRGGGRGSGSREVNGRGRHTKNKTWVAGGSRSGTSTPNHSDSDRWERGGHRGGRGRGTGQPRIFPNASLVVPHPPSYEDPVSGGEEQDGEEFIEEDADNQEDELIEEVEEPELDTQEAREKFYQEVRVAVMEETCNSLHVGSS
jgi:hypothetical protein